MKKKLFAKIGLLSMSLVIMLSACSLPNISAIKPISTAEFWYGLEEQGYDVDSYEATDALLSVYGDALTDICTDYAYYYDDPIEYALFVFNDNSSASSFYAQLESTYEDMTSSHENKSMGSVRLFKGSNKADDFTCLAYKVDDVILMAASDIEDSDRIAKVSEYLMTTDFGNIKDFGNEEAELPQETDIPDADRELQVAPESDTSRNEMVVDESAESAMLSGALYKTDRDGPTYTISWDYESEFSIPTKADWEVDDQYSYTLYADTDNIYSYYRNSGYCTEEEVAEALVDIFGCDMNNFRKTTYDGEDIIVGAKEDDFGTRNFYVFQDVGREEYLLIAITVFDDTPANEAISNFIIP